MRPELYAYFTNLESIEIHSSYSANDATLLNEIIGHLATIPTLTSLKLTDNELCVVPPSIEQMKQLKFLNLGYNDIEQIPPFIAGMTSLEHINLELNNLYSIPDLSRLTSLKVLNVSSNELEVLPDSICNLTAMQELYVSRNKLSKLPDELGKLEKLHVLDIGNNSLRSMPPIRTLKELRIFDASVNLFESIPDEIFEMDSLTRLSLLNACNRSGDGSCSQLRPSFTTLRHFGVDELE